MFRERKIKIDPWKLPASGNLIKEEMVGDCVNHYHEESMVQPSAGEVGDDGKALASKKNTVQPCAACRLLRRRCAPECPFSPYFSPDEPHKFASVHKVFGASNVSKMLMEVPEDQRADTANSLVYEAMVRLRDPVYGSVGSISILQHQVQSLEAELNAVRAELVRYKLKNSSMTIPPNPIPLHEANLPIPSDISSDPDRLLHNQYCRKKDHPVLW